MENGPVLTSDLSDFCLCLNPRIFQSTLAALLKRNSPASITPESLSGLFHTKARSLTAQEQGAAPKQLLMLRATWNFTMKRLMRKSTNSEFILSILPFRLSLQPG